MLETEKKTPLDSHINANKKEIISDLLGTVTLY